MGNVHGAECSCEGCGIELLTLADLALHRATVHSCVHCGASGAQPCLRKMPSHGTQSRPCAPLAACRLPAPPLARRLSVDSHLQPASVLTCAAGIRAASPRLRGPASTLACRMYKQEAAVQPHTGHVCAPHSHPAWLRPTQQPPARSVRARRRRSATRDAGVTYTAGVPGMSFLNFEDGSMMNDPSRTRDSTHTFLHPPDGTHPRACLPSLARTCR